MTADRAHLVGVLLAVAVVLLLAGCTSTPDLFGTAGTAMQFEGTICGEPVRFSATDLKDRSGFEATITCGEDGGVHVVTSESNASQAMVMQAEAISKLAGAIAAGISPASIGVLR